MRKAERTEQRDGLKVLLKGRRGVSHEFLFLPSNTSSQFLRGKDWWNPIYRTAYTAYVCMYSMNGWTNGFISGWKEGWRH